MRLLRCVETRSNPLDTDLSRQCDVAEPGYLLLPLLLRRGHRRLLVAVKEGYHGVDYRGRRDDVVVRGVEDHREMVLAHARTVAVDLLASAAEEFEQLCCSGKLHCCRWRQSCY